MTWLKPAGFPVATKKMSIGSDPVVLLEDYLPFLEHRVEEDLDLRGDGGELVDADDAPVAAEDARAYEGLGVRRAVALDYGLYVLDAEDLRLVRVLVSLDAAVPFLPRDELYLGVFDPPT